MDYFAAVRAFLHAADLESFSKAARQMALKVSTVSRYVTELEGDLGIALFNRSTRGLALTEGGRIFREHALVALKALEDARQVTSSLNASPKGLLRVTMPPSFGRRHVMKHLPQFMERYPQISVDAVVTDEVVNLIEAGIDLAIRIGALPDSQLMARKLAPHRRVVCASPRYITTNGTPSCPEDLSNHVALRSALASDDKWILVKRNTKTKSKKPGTAVQLHGRLRVNDTDAILDLAIAGCGIALLPTWSIGSALASGKLVQLLPDWEARTTRADPAVWAVYPPKKVVSSKVRAFVDFYAALFEQERYWAQ
jgi:DNA-binding transcriptional LysR family regulator